MVDFLKMAQQVQEMQARIQQMQDALEHVTVVGAAGGGMVKVEADGKGQVKRVSIDPSVANPADVEMLEDLVAAAVRDAQKKASEAAQQEMGKVTGGLDLPLPFKLPF
ncbi:MAG: YbaB/EbfC family nucleoid-associated protein [Gemmatimonadetes bacterium]|nr:YbaB/EbfC family nucleoid-associated protein [Gemmatimonadota bacterium]